jgi:hypothetical protein
VIAGGIHGGSAFNGTGGDTLIETTPLVSVLSEVPFASRFRQPFGRQMRETAFFDVMGLLNLAESVYKAMLKNRVLPSGAGPDHFKFPLVFPHSYAKAFAVVSNGSIKEIEIQHETGETERIPSPKF